CPVFPGPRCRVLPRGNGTLSGFWVLLATLFIAASSCVKQRRATSCPFPESTASGGSCLAWTSPGLRPRPWRRPSASGRAVSPSVTCRPWFPPFGRRHGNASVKRRSGSSRHRCSRNVQERPGGFAVLLRDAAADVWSGRPRRRHLHRPISQSGVRRAIGANLLARARRHGGIRRSVVDREREAAAGGNRREPCCRARVDGASPPAAAAGAAVDVAQAWTVTTSSPCWRSRTARALSSCSRPSRRPVAPPRSRVTAASHSCLTCSRPCPRYALQLDPAGDALFGRGNMAGGLACDVKWDHQARGETWRRR